MRRVIVYVVLLALLLSGCGAPVDPDTAQESIQVLAMDTAMLITTYGERSPAAAYACEDTIRDLEKQLSRTDPDSEVSRLNAAGGEAVEVGEDLYILLHEAACLSAETRGAFDVTVAPVVSAWGFTEDSFRVPSQKELEELTMAAREKELPVGTIQFRTRSLEEGIAFNEENRYGYNLEDRCFYPIYPSFVRTIEDLEKAGVTFVKLDETTVTDVRIRYYWDPEKMAGDSGQTADGGVVFAETWDKDSDESWTAIYDDEKDLKRLIPALIFLDYRNMNCYYEMEMPANADTFVTANFDISSDHQDRGRSSGGFGINMKLLSSEDTVRFKLAGQEETP